MKTNEQMETGTKMIVDKCTDKGLIERTISNKPNSRLQKYRLTTKGLELKNKILEKDLTDILPENKILKTLSLRPRSKSGVRVPFMTLSLRA